MIVKKLYYLYKRVGFNRFDNGNYKKHDITLEVRIERKKKQKKMPRTLLCNKSSVYMAGSILNASF